MHWLPASLAGRIKFLQNARHFFGQLHVLVMVASFNLIKQVCML